MSIISLLTKNYLQFCDLQNESTDLELGQTTDLQEFGPGHLGGAMQDGGLNLPGARWWLTSILGCN